MSKRIAVTGSGSREDTFVAKALSIMCGYDLCISPSFSQTAIKYGMNMDIQTCHWPDSYVYCLDVFTERIIMEHQYGEKFVSDGSVLKESVWLKCRFPHVEPIYEQSMIRSLERVVAAYAVKNYDAVFYLSGGQGSRITGDCMERLLETYGIPYRAIHSPDRETALNSMMEYSGIPPVMSAKFSLSKTMRESGLK
ncbi:MAG: hypothetical protein LBG96_06130 [Tannerella sp.]|jgi:hypothetical protein|nr:hypothetical protein [Tannerella sp.]